MSDSDDCALNDDGTLKDASEIAFVHSPTDQHRKSLAALSDIADLPSSVTFPKKTSDAGEEVVGKRVPRPVEKVNGEKSLNFFTNTVNQRKDSNSKSNGGASKEPRKRLLSSDTAPKSGKRVRESPANQDNPARKPTTKTRDHGQEAKEGDLEHGNKAETDSDDDPEELYEELNRMSAGDRSLTKRKHSIRGKDARTDDIRTCFSAATREVDGVEKQGNFCNICKNVLKIRESDCFFTGNGTTLRTHIKRTWESHGPIYRKKCGEKGIPMHPRACGEDEAEAEANSDQGNLDKFLMPRWTVEGFRGMIVNLIVDNFSAIRLVDKKSFRNLLMYQRPSMRESDIPHRTTLTDEIIFKAGLVQDRLSANFKNAPGEISITFDAWTSGSSDPYLGITAHYISSPVDQPNVWKLESVLIGFEEIQGNHGGANMASILLRVLDRYGIRNKLGWLTGDNVGVNDTAARYIQRAEGVDRPDRPWKARQRRGRCMEHTVQLGAKAFVETLYPSVSKKKKKTKSSVSWGDSDDNDSGEEEGDEADWISMDTTDDMDELDAAVSFEPGDLLGKVLALINQIRASPQAKAYFKTMCIEEGLAPLELIKWIRIRWGSMSDLIDRALENKAAINKFCLLADTSTKVPTLKNKTYGDYQIEKEEWKMLAIIDEVLKEPRGAQSSFSSETRPTVSKTLPILEFLIERWTNFMALSKFESVAPALNAGIEKLNKWYQKTDSSDMYFVCLALDPAVKLEYCRCKWDKKSFDAGVKAFHATFDSYTKRLKATKPNSDAMPTNKNATSPIKAGGYGASWLQEAIQSRIQKESSPSNPRQEMEDYLKAPLEIGVKDPVAFWGYHSTQYPTLALMARDYLAIQGSSVAAERAFSASGQTGTVRRNKLSPETFGALQILRSGYKAGLIDALDDARACEPDDWEIDE